MEHVEVVNQNQHMQGFSSGNGFMYFSFTDSLVKTTMNGTVKCQVEVRGGHLGDIDYYDGKIYGSYLGNSLPGHDWNDWTSFKIYVFDADDLKVIDIINMDICDYYKSIACTEEDTRGFQAIDGVAIGKDPLTGERKLFVACALYNGEKYYNQIILQCSLDGKYEKEYHIPTGNTVFGIQNLDYDESTEKFWFSTYGSSIDYQAKETLYCTNKDITKAEKKFKFSSPYGFECLGDGHFFCSVQWGENKKRAGSAYRCDESFFQNILKEKEVIKFVFGEEK